jgi:excisionase family DNA binding protein
MQIVPRTLTISEAARNLSASVKFVRTLIWRREIPYLKAGKRFVIDRADLDAWIDRSKPTA